jgi:polysaccharide biosynthesis protein PslG
MRVKLLSGVVVAALSLGAAHSLTSSGANLAGRPSPFFGIAPQTALRDDDLALMRRTGIGSIRFPIYWSESEPAPGVFDWRTTDARLTLTSRVGFELLPFVYSSPAWVAPTWVRMPVRTPTQRQAWSRFLRALVGRYGPDGDFWKLHPELLGRPLRTWQIWNEENDHRHAEASVRDYARLLRRSAPAIRSVDPGARLLLGGLYAAPGEEPSTDAPQFLDRLYRYRGIKGLFDAAALHPYAPDPGQMAAHIAALRAVMRRNGDGGSPLYITEFGWGSQTRAAGGDGFERGPTAQADYLKRAWAILLRNRRRWKLESAYWFTWQDVPAWSTRCGFCDSTGLLGLDGQPKAALRRFTEMARR